MMITRKIFQLLLFLTLPFYIVAQGEWQAFYGSDAIADYEFDGDTVWTISGSGLNCTNIVTGERTNWNRLNSDIPHYNYTSLAINKNEGSIWLVKNGDIDEDEETFLSIFDGNTWSLHTQINNETITSLDHMESDQNGDLWIYARTGGNPLFHYSGGVFTALEPAPGMSFSGTLNPKFHIDNNNHIWIGLSDGSSTYLGQYTGTDWIVHDVSTTLAVSWFSGSVVSDSQNNIFLLDPSESGDWLYKYDGTVWQTIPTPEGYGFPINLADYLYMDDNDHLWAYPGNSFGLGELLKYDGQEWTTLEFADYGIVGSHAFGCHLDQYGTIWLLRSFFYKINNGTVSTLDLSQGGGPANTVRWIAFDDYDNKWITAENDLWHFTSQESTNVGRPPFGYHYNFETDEEGTVWGIGYSELFKFDGLTFSHFPLFYSNGAELTQIRDITFGSQGKFSVLGAGQVISYDNGNTTYFSPPDQSDILGAIAYKPNSDTLFVLGADNLHILVGGNLINTIDAPNSSWSISLTIAPNGDLWATFGTSLGSLSGYKIFNGTSWNDFEHPFNRASQLQWDSEGNLWMRTEQGICKQTGSDWSCLDISNSPLNLEGLSFFRIDEADNIWITQSGGGLYVYNENNIQDLIPKPRGLATGTIYKDENQNLSFDTTDIPLTWQKVSISPSATITFTDSEGKYKFRPLSGEHTVEYIESPNWNSDALPAPYTFNIGTDTVAGLDFSISPIQEIDSINLYLHPGFPRCNSVGLYGLTCFNSGTYSYDGEIRYLTDPNTTVLETTPPFDYLDGDTMVWTFSDLLPLQQKTIYLDISHPDASFIDSTLHFGAHVDVLEGSQVRRLAEELYTTTLLCSYDPNDKLVQPEGDTLGGYSLIENALNYTIRFQNTGNDTAFTVTIRDTLDSALDLNTFAILGASHEFVATLTPDGALQFLFEDILLPDSATNEIRSQGFISYQIKAQAQLVLPVHIENKAYIYFDFNPAILTNTTENNLRRSFDFDQDGYTFLEDCDDNNALANPGAEEIANNGIDEDCDGEDLLSGTEDVLTIQPQIFPNPSSGMLQIIFPEAIQGTYELRTLTGKLLLENTLGEKTRLDLSHLPKAVYILLLKTKNGTWTERVVRM